MKVFISWSGDRSKRIAEALRDWLPRVIQAIDPWLSSEDIQKGSQWLPEIVGSLHKADVGIICLTSDNLTEPWILFESGALSKSLDRARVCTYLFDIAAVDVSFPLAMFQHTVANQDETRRLLSTINNELVEKRLSERALDETFAVWWGKLEAQFEEIRHMPSEAPVQRSQSEILEEILNLVRAQRNSLSSRISEALADGFGRILTKRFAELLAVAGHDQKDVIEKATEKALETTGDKEVLKTRLREKLAEIEAIEVDLKLPEEFG